MIFWTTRTTDDEDKNYDVYSRLSAGERNHAAGDRVPVQDRSVHGGYAVMSEDECYEAQDRPTRLLTPELAFVAIMIGFGLVIVVCAILGIAEVGHD